MPRRACTADVKPFPLADLLGPMPLCVSLLRCALRAVVYGVDIKWNGVAPYNVVWCCLVL